MPAPTDYQSNEKKSPQVYEDSKLEAGSPQVPIEVGSIDEFSIPEEHLTRGLESRHIQMIALAGAIGTGLFLSSGKAIARAGPVGALLGYAAVGLIVCCVNYTVGETATLAPVSGAYIRHCEYFVDEALAFAYGWNNVYSSIVSSPAEIAAAAVLFEFWTDKYQALFITILAVLIFATNVVSVRGYGEVEFYCSILKLSLVVMIVIMSFVIDVGGVKGQPAIGFQYWRNPGPFASYLLPGAIGKFTGFWSVFINAAYAYSGVESVAICAAETKNPIKAIPKATKRVFYRVFGCYIVCVFFAGLVVPSTNATLIKGSGASRSAFVIAAQLAGIKVLPHIINAIVITSAWSSGNHSTFAGSRTLYGLALEHKAPEIFLKVNRFGIPWVAVSFICAFMALGYMTLQSGASTVFNWFQDLVSASALTSWMIICLTNIRLRSGMKAQGIPRSALPWKSALSPIGPWIGLIGSGIILITGGYSVFINGEWSVETFFASYFNIPFILVTYFGYKWIKKTKLVPLHSMPVNFFLRRTEWMDMANEESVERKTILSKVAGFLWD